jgi:hypothetical protein
MEDKLSSGTVCRNPSFELVTKTKGLQGCRPKGSLGVKAKRSPGVTSHTFRNVRKCEGVEGVNPHTPKTTPTLGDGIPVDFQNFKKPFQGSKLNGL